jgi:7,8-dihydropterin-6-yl-methyl-4-(beta-D-ribofuranosyl)aminobenzene 5'-phosphate synthase
MVLRFITNKVRRMASQAKVVFRHEMDLAKSGYASGQWATAIHHLERAHIVGQRYFWAHLVTHLWMLRIAFLRQDTREGIGQITRLLAVLPGYIFGWVPVGNTGGANVSPIKPMPIPLDLATSFVGYSLQRQIIWRLVVFALLAIAAWALFTAAPVDPTSAGAEQTQQLELVLKVADFGTTETLEIIPLVNWHAKDKTLRTEAGVSYLIKTDNNTVLFDTGWNEKDEEPSPLRHNMGVLGIQEASIDSIFISHAHHDHLGGFKWEREGSLSLSRIRSDLSGTRVFSPIPLTYPGISVQTITGAAALLPAIASTGGIARNLATGRVVEQAMVINVAGKGLVVIVGCGHQTVPKLLAKIKREFSMPLYGIVGDLHYPVPSGRRYFLGINLQRFLASGDGITNPMDMEQIIAEMDMLDSQNIQLLGIGGHDSSDEVIDLFAKRFGSRYQHVAVGTKIVLN